MTDGDRVLFEAGPDFPVVPASLTKLLTAAAALEAIGEDARLRTSVRASTPATDGVVAGDLWLVGGGDPVLGTDAWADQLGVDPPLHTSLDRLADGLAATGVRQVNGAVLGDESRYDAVRYVDTWPRRLIEDGEGRPMSALSVNDGFRVWGHPGIPFDDPPAQAAAIFSDLLAARGILVAGAARAGRSTPGAVELAGIDSPPVGELVHRMLRDSDNGTAELLVKEVGLRRSAAGSTRAGVQAIRSLLDNDGVPLDGVTIADGSGLSEANRLTCSAITRLLGGRARDLSGRLSVAGRDGTLVRRFRDTPLAGRIRAKTGSLDGVAALAGYADNTTGATLTFSIIINALPSGVTGRGTLDAAVAAFVNVAP